MLSYLSSFGVREPDCAGLIHIEMGKAPKTVLFVPKLPKEYATIMGRIPSLEELRSRYGVDQVLYNSDDYRGEYLNNFVDSVLSEHQPKPNPNANTDNNKADKSHPVLSQHKEEEITESAHTDNDKADKSDPTQSQYKENGEIKNGDNDTDNAQKSHQTGKAYDANKPTILLMKGINSDSGKPFLTPTTLPSSLETHIDRTVLYPIFAECRVIKTQHELSLLRHVTELTSIAHVHTMRQTVPGTYEYQAEATFRYVSYYHFGARLAGYTSICACGPSAAVLHYGHAGAPNDGKIKEGSLCLHDMGAEYFGYGSDVTCTFPAGGVFDSRQRTVYEGVLDAQRVVLRMMKPGVSWTDCHKAAEAEVLRALIKLGVVILIDGKSIEDLVELRVGAVFMPHGLGHLIGIDTHDVGGYVEDRTPERSELPGLKSLRTARILEEGMTITVEPGCYFIKHLMDEALRDDSPVKPYLEKEVLKEYVGFGGVRLEDVVAVTKDGCDNFTICPRTVNEVEYVKAGGQWPPKKDEAKELKRSRLLNASPLTGLELVEEL